MTNCVQCGAVLAPGAAFCARCGAMVAAAGPGGPGAPQAAGQPAPQAFGGLLNDWQSSASRPSVSGATSLIGDIKGSATNGRSVPQLAMVTAGAAGLLALLWVISSIKALFDVFRLGDLLRLLGGGVSLTVALVLVVIIGFAVAALWLAIAWLVRGGSRLALPLIYVAGAASLFGGSNGGYELRGTGALGVVARLLAVGVLALTFVPEVRGHLTGTPTDGRPATLVASEALLLWFGVTAAVLGVAFVLIGIASGSGPYSVGGGGSYIAAVGMIAAAGVALVFAHAVGRADATARLIVSGGAIVFVILMAIAGDLNGSWYHVVTLAGIAALLWLATDARIAFGDTALDVSRLQGGRPPVQPQSPPAPYEKPAAQPGEPPVV